MEYMPLPNVYPNMHVPYVGYIRRPLIESDPVLLLIVEAIDYSLRYHNLHNWVPTWNLEFLRMNNTIRHFDEYYAAAVIDPNTEEQVIWLADTLGFNVGNWLDLIYQEETRRHLQCYFLAIYNYTNPFPFHMFSFACYVSRVALQSNRNSLVNDVAWALLLALRQIGLNEEYYIEYNYVVNMYDNHYVNNQPLEVDAGQPLDVDEGIVENSSRRNSTILSLVPSDMILLFVKELIDYYLRYNNFQGLITSQDLPVLRSCPNDMRYFNENLASAIIHHCSEQDALRVAHEGGFDEETWLVRNRLSDAENFQSYFIRPVFLPSRREMFRMLAFACYACKIARRRSRARLVNAVKWALVDFLRQHFPYELFYWQLEDHANWYTNHHYELHSQSYDEGVEDETSSSEESSGHSSEEETTSQSDD